MPNKLRVIALEGNTPYLDAHRLQQETVAAVKSGDAPHTLILVEHHPVITLGKNADNAGVFLDVGHSGWVDAETVWKKVSEYENRDHIDGFALNTSNFQPTENETKLAEELFALSGKPSIIDTSRNGCGVPSTIHNPDDDEWCVGDEFAHPDDAPAVLFNYHNKPWDQAD